MPISRQPLLGSPFGYIGRFEAAPWAPVAPQDRVPVSWAELRHPNPASTLELDDHLAHHLVLTPWRPPRLQSRPPRLPMTSEGAAAKSVTGCCGVRVSVERVWCVVGVNHPQGVSRSAEVNHPSNERAGPRNEKGAS